MPPGNVKEVRVDIGIAKEHRIPKLGAFLIYNSRFTLIIVYLHIWTLKKERSFKMNRKWYGFAAALLMVAAICCGAEKKSLVAEGAKVEKLTGDFKFTEGAASDAEGNVFFSDIPNNRILKWSLDGKLSTFRENSGGANGLFVDKKGNVVACEGAGRRLVSIDPKGSVTVLADKYQDKRFNSPNDLWIDPNGGIYFTDPRYGSRDGMEQDGEHVYYLSPDHKKLIRVINDMVRPNGIIGTADGKLLYVADHGGNKTFVYTINKRKTERRDVVRGVQLLKDIPLLGALFSVRDFYTINMDGTLSNKKLFASEGSDGMTIDNQGNVYLTTKVVAVYSSKGQMIETIDVPEGPANLCFGGKNKQTLFITARTSLYAVRMRVKGIGSG